MLIDVPLEMTYRPERLSPDTRPDNSCPTHTETGETMAEASQHFAVSP
jgi:hypothetical protein